MKNIPIVVTLLRKNNNIAEEKDIRSYSVVV